MNELQKTFLLITVKLQYASLKQHWQTLFFVLIQQSTELLLMKWVPMLLAPMNLIVLEIVSYYSVTAQMRKRNFQSK